MASDFVRGAAIGALTGVDLSAGAVRSYAAAQWAAGIGPTLLAVAGYDSKATTQWAAGVGPTLLSYFWLGGDKYRSYDAVVTVQAGYIFSVGPDQRQRGWRGSISVTF
jgi:hypothetical protein